MLGLIRAFALSGLPAVAPTLSQTGPVPDRQLRVGKHHFEKAGLLVDVDLNADGTARYQVNAGRADGFLGCPRGSRPHLQQARTGEVGASGGAHACSGRGLTHGRAIAGWITSR